jgi:methionyl-tRNA synthetase
MIGFYLTDAMFILMASIEDFQKIELRVGKIVDVTDAETKKPMYVLKVDFGNAGARQIVAGIKPYYSKEEILGKKFIFVFNLDSKKIANTLSEGMILAASNEEKDKVVILQPERDIETGARVS